jgi:hypothetical protein
MSKFEIYQKNINDSNDFSKHAWGLKYIPKKGGVFEPSPGDAIN